MDRELETLIKAYDAVTQARGSAEHRRLIILYENLITDALDRRPGLDRDSLRSAIRVAHWKWLVAQRQPPTIPPQA
jgi:hypothetical protein